MVEPITTPILKRYRSIILLDFSGIALVLVVISQEYAKDNNLKHFADVSVSP